MSSPENVPAPVPPVSAPAAPQNWPVLSTLERRVLGVLVEKAKTTPDAYPLSLNALVVGCNQKSNREPIMNLDDSEIEDGLARLQEQHLVSKIVGGRVERWRHLLYEGWRVNKVELAVLAELLLRGPQTEGELRARASRMEPIDTLDALRSVLRVLKERDLVVYLVPEGRRGTTVAHGFHSPDELQRLRQHAAEPPEHEPATRPLSPVPLPAASQPHLEAQLREAQAEIAACRADVANLQNQVAELAAQVQKLREALPTASATSENRSC